MSYRPKTDFETDTEELTPAEAHDRWERVTNLDTPELERLEDSKRNQEYLEQAEGNQTGDPPLNPDSGPLEDAQTLAETPRDEWTKEHRAEADEAINFLSRTLPQFDQSEGEALVDEGPKIHKDELSIARWGVDVRPEDDFL